jgi:hypothetical protein
MIPRRTIVPWLLYAMHLSLKFWSAGIRGRRMIESCDTAHDGIRIDIIKIHEPLIRPPVMNFNTGGESNSGQARNARRFTEATRQSGDSGDISCHPKYAA